MGLLVDGQWQAQERARTGKDGAFQRPESPWRRWVTADGQSGFKAEPDRYHLFVNQGCPWAYRTLLYRRLKGLEDCISLSFTHPAMGREGWTFEQADGSSSDGLFGARQLHEIYTRADPAFSGRVTVPVLWDKQTGTIVNNESSEIIRMLGREFDAFASSAIDFYPAAQRAEIDALNERIYATVNNGVYRCGFAGSQQAYDDAFDALFETLDVLDARLADRRYLCGDHVTEADWRLLPTLQRFDLAYYGAFRCNRQRLVDYAHLWPYARDLHQYPGVAETVSEYAFKAIYWSGRGGIIPRGPAVDWSVPHGRAALQHSERNAEAN